MLTLLFLQSTQLTANSNEYHTAPPICADGISSVLNNVHLQRGILVIKTSWKSEPGGVPKGLLVMLILVLVIAITIASTTNLEVYSYING